MYCIHKLRCNQSGDHNAFYGSSGDNVMSERALPYWLYVGVVRVILSMEEPPFKAAGPHRRTGPAISMDIIRMQHEVPHRPHMLGRRNGCQGRGRGSSMWAILVGWAVLRAWNLPAVAGVKPRRSLGYLHGRVRHQEHLLRTFHC